jgi:DNA-binding FadR family transcriptional regulator
VNPETPIDSRRAKLAGHAAEQIMADVAERGWPVGQILGSERELLERYGVSRAVLREAVRLLEHQHVARMRRGPRGGLVVTEPDIDAVIGPVILYLLRVDATLDEVIDTRVVLEEMVAEIAAARIDDSGIAALRQELRNEAVDESGDHWALHSQLAAITRNKVLELFVEVLHQVSSYYVCESGELTPELHREVLAAHRGIANAVINGDSGAARARMHRHLIAGFHFLTTHPATAQRLDASTVLAGTVDDKGAETLARILFAAIITTDAQPGDMVGSEATLMAKYSVSRAVLREAVRILEYHQVALMRRGPGGGLVVASPDLSALTEIIAIYLRRRGVEPGELGEVRTGLELATLERAAAQMNPEAVAIIDRSLDTEAALGFYHAFRDGHDFHSVLATLTQNRALELVHRVSMRLGWLFFSQTESDPAVQELARPTEVGHAHRDIADALRSGNTKAALARMRSHLAVTSGPKA